jgi:hypothetical protein
VNPPVGIGEGDDLAAGHGGSAVPGGGDRPLLDLDDPAAALPGDLRRGVGRGVVGDDDLDLLAVGRAGRIDAVEQAGEELRLVVGRNDQADAWVGHCCGEKLVTVY